MATQVFQATGRRKEAVASVRLKSGEGKFLINGKALKEYVSGRQAWIQDVEKPLQLTNTLGKVDVFCRTRGGGVGGQAGAICLGLARALVKMDETFRKILRSSGLLTRDPRMVERKKYGQIKARKRYQYSKR